MLTNSISDIRKQFEDIDKSILILLGIRIKLSSEIGKLKKDNHIDVTQLNVWKHQMENRVKENEKFKIDSDFMDKIFNLIHEESIRIQNQEFKK